MDGAIQSGLRAARESLGTRLMPSEPDAEMTRCISEREGAALIGPTLPAPTAVSRFLSALLSEHATNLFLARLVSDPGAMEAIAARVRPEDLARKADWMERPILRFFETRIAAGKLVPLP